MHKYFLIRFPVTSPSSEISQVESYCNSPVGEKSCFSVFSDSWINALNEFIDEVTIDKYHEEHEEDSNAN